jgi:hypothetical protein
MKEIGLLPYLYESEEFQAFIRPQGDVEKCLKTLPKMTTDQLLERYRNVMPVNEVS